MNYPVSIRQFRYFFNGVRVTALTTKCMDIDLAVQPVQSITSVKYTDTAGDLQTLDSGAYELGERNGRGMVRLQYGETWPMTLDHPDSVVVRTVCGYGLAAAVPDAIVRAVATIATALATHRGDADFEIPKAARAMLSLNTFRTA